MNTAVEFCQTSRCFGDVRAVDQVSLKIAEGEFFSMLGPSGSGKTTCLRLIAGFEQPDDGHVIIHGRDATGLPPYQRNVNTVFQDYALFPHMNVLDNIAYGLMVKGVNKKERQHRAAEALDMVALGQYGQRKPAQLSGGQRQRIALARALVNRPRVLLLDEPLGALDLKLREQMQGELKRLQRQLGITFVFVTHDQTEALSMSDRVAVFNQGRIEQLDSPRNLYNQPQTAFVAGFVGSSNVLHGALAQQLSGKSAALAIRPEYISIRHSGSAVPSDTASTELINLPGVIKDVQYQGSNTRIEVELEPGVSIAASEANSLLSNHTARLPGQSVQVSWSRQAMVSLRDNASV
ncbi:MULTISPECIES: ABC transporter ATP-binding protein [unclassified Oceanobacter]|uniref:ABC transporter ATP-binding protein n=1 Tax=unclassified Oceanobacter TaxID=2620260 RepID=UPI002734494B|nr:MULTISPECIES: ABC transporter ATP-binding protein [unclassified Oceanobacter]MDP2505863.1 ABC transporter ATP-binding protein [Oceanobacter sp. 3_MG-2023]MDP2608343.1 ABC transporter ATP-binding protein [Oceanobacter sp. 1_MG-2023]MDP2611438.1 ABC transporter ATP-binding protein [Oceanobacter sp. 2_MG-2023]